MQESFQGRKPVSKVASSNLCFMLYVLTEEYWLQWRFSLNIRDASDKLMTAVQDTEYVVHILLVGYCYIFVMNFINDSIESGCPLR